MRFFYLLMAVLAIAMVAISTPTNAYTGTEGFIEYASINNKFEILSSQLALKNSQNQNVRDFAQKMIDDNTRMADDMKTALAAIPSGDVAKPIQPMTTLDLQHQMTLDKLKSVSGADFDKLYVSDQIKAHKEAIKLFQGYVKDGDSGPLKDFATNNLPTLQQHQKIAKQLRDAVDSN